MRPTHGLALALLLIAPAARAAPATPDEASRLTAVFERYVGRGGAVTVVPDGESYTATVDLGRLFAFAKALKVEVAAGPLVARLTPQADGQWRVVVDGLPPFGITAAGKTTSFSYEGFRQDGLFDPRLQAFSTATSEGRGSSVRSTGPDGASTATISETASGTYAARDAGGGTVDVTSPRTSKNIDYLLTVEPGAGEADSPSRRVKAHVDAAATSLTATGLRTVALNELWAFLVAHPSKAEVAGSQADLKTRLKAALPPATSAGADVSLTKVVVDTPLGTFGAAGFSQHYEVNGPASKDGVRSTLKLDGLTMPAGLLPPWAAPIVPSALDLATTVGPIRVQPVLSDAIDALDLSADKPLSDERIAALRDSLGAGEVSVHLAPSTIASPSLSLRLDGDLRLTRPMPTGTATVSAAGLDKTIDLIRAAAPEDPMAAQAVAAMTAAKMLARAEGPDSYVWRVEALPGQEVRINGAPLAAPAAGAKPKQRKPALQP